MPSVTQKTIKLICENKVYYFDIYCTLPISNIILSPIELALVMPRESLN
jgi:hypothetical protein